MRNPLVRLRNVLREMLVNGRGTLAASQALAERVEDLERSMAMMASDLRNVSSNADRPAGQDGAPPAREPLATRRVEARILALADLLVPQRAVGVAKCRVGPAADGGYVMLDDWAGIVGAVSIGIGNDDAWDRAVAARGLPVAQFDHTIAAPPGTGPGLGWRPLGLGPVDVNDLRCLASLIAVSGLPATGDLALKMDAEGAEWPALAAGAGAAPLQRFRQVVIEFHWFDMVATRSWFETASRALDHLHRTHAVVHVHANNHAGGVLLGGVFFPRVLEVTFARRDSYALESETCSFPTPLDAPCDPGRPDIWLGPFRFPAPRAEEPAPQTALGSARRASQAEAAS
jgi:hypothetical protein